MSDKFISIGVGVETGQLKTGIDEAVSKVNTLGDSIKTTLDEPAKKTQTTFKNLGQAFRQTAKDAQEIAMAQGTASAAFQEAVIKARDYKRQLDEVNAAIYANDAAITNQPNVINKTISSYNGLGNSINQLTREMPAFTYSIQTGFMALSNNIPIFVDQITKLKAANAALAASGQPVQSVVSQIGAAVFSWNTALSLGITAVTMFAPALANLVSGANEADKAFKKAEKSLSEFNDEIANYLMTSETEKLIKEENKKYEGFIQPLKDYVKIYEAQRDILAMGDRKMDEESQKRYYDSRKQLEQIEKQHQQNIKKIIDDARKETERKSTIKDKPIADIKRKDAVFNPISDAVDLKAWGDNLNAATIPLGNFINTAQEKYAQFLEMTARFNEDIRRTLESGVESAFINMASTIGESLANGTNVIDNIGAVLLGTVGSMAIQLGQLAIGVGITMDAIKTAFTNPFTAIAAGIALIALGSFVSSKAKAITSGKSSSGMSSSGGGGGYSPSNAYSGFTPNSNEVSINSRLIGTDLLLSVQKSNKKMERIR